MYIYIYYFNKSKIYVIYKMIELYMDQNKIMCVKLQLLDHILVVVEDKHMLLLLL